MKAITVLIKWKRQLFNLKLKLGVTQQTEKQIKDPSIMKENIHSIPLASINNSKLFNSLAINNMHKLKYSN